MPLGSKKRVLHSSILIRFYIQKPKSLPKVPESSPNGNRSLSRWFSCSIYPRNLKKHIKVLKIAVQSRVHTRRKHHPEVNVLLAKPRREAWASLNSVGNCSSLMKLSLSTLVMILTSISPTVRLLSKKIF
jgi:hypothetical protein